MRWTAEEEARRAPLIKAVKQVHITYAALCELAEACEEPRIRAQVRQTYEQLWRLALSVGEPFMNTFRNPVGLDSHTGVWGRKVYVDGQIIYPPK